MIINIILPIADALASAMLQGYLSFSSGCVFIYYKLRFVLSVTNASVTAMLEQLMPLL